MRKIIPTLKLNSGREMPVIGLGTYQSAPDEVEDAVKYAIDVGYRLIDTAYIYGNEIEVGKAVKAKISEGVIKREDIFITTKLWCHHHDHENVEHACRISLKNLNLDYLNLYLMHFPGGSKFMGDENPRSKDENGVIQFSDVDYLETWKGMEKLVKLGLVHSIGVSNFNRQQIDRLCKNCEILPVTNQVECHLNLSQEKLDEFCKPCGITLTAYSPLGKPNFQEKRPTFLFDEKMLAIAKKYNKAATQIALRYLLQLGRIVIPKSVTKERIENNIDIFDFELQTDDMNALEEYDNHGRIVVWVPFIGHTFYPFNDEF